MTRLLVQLPFKPSPISFICPPWFHWIWGISVQLLALPTPLFFLFNIFASLFITQIDLCELKTGKEENNHHLRMMLLCKLSRWLNCLSFPFIVLDRGHYELNWHSSSFYFLSVQLNLYDCLSAVWFRSIFHIWTPSVVKGNRCLYIHGSCL